MNTFWYHFLIETNTSPTLPFLVGAYRYIRSDDSFCISTLFDEFANTPIPENIEISIRLCPSLNQYVISRYWRYGSLQSSPLKLLGNRTVSYEPSAEILGNDLNALVEFFNKVYGMVLVESRYSRDYNTGKWRRFNSEEIYQISRIARLN